MNNKSGSALQKASFVLLVLILCGLAYLILLERARRERRAAEEAAEVAANKPDPTPTTASNPAETKPSFAPLRARVETNKARAFTGTIIVAPKNTSASVESPVVPRTPATTPTASAALAENFGGGIGGGIVAGAGNGGASVVGHVTLRGTPRPEIVIALDPACGRLNPAPLTTRHFVVGPDGGLANVFVYVKAGAPLTAPPANAPVLDQVNCEYQPFVLGVQAGQTLNARNSDPLLHNVHVLPANPPNKERNVGQPVKGMTSPFVFPAAEVFVKFRCNVHPWMFAYVGVVGHPWFAVTDKSGNFALPVGLPPGQYTLAAVHVKAGEVLQQINVSGDGATPVNFTLDVPAP